MVVLSPALALSRTHNTSRWRPLLVLAAAAAVVAGMDGWLVGEWWVESVLLNDAFIRGMYLERLPALRYLLGPRVMMLARLCDL